MPPMHNCCEGIGLSTHTYTHMQQTDSKYTLMVSGTGHAGMEACIANLVEPGDKVVVGNAGIWGERVAEMSRRFRGEERTRTVRSYRYQSNYTV